MRFQTTKHIIALITAARYHISILIDMFAVPRAIRSVILRYQFNSCNIKNHLYTANPIIDYYII